MTKRTVAKVCFGLIWLYLLAFMIGTLVLGGDAINGYAAHGRYFLNDKGHFTEVSRAVFLYSRWHSITCMIAAPIGIACGWYAYGARFRKNSN